MRTTVSSKGQIVLPVELRRRDGLKSGEIFEVERLDEGDYRLRRVESPPNEGLVDWLLSCPEKGFLDGLMSAETTDDIQSDIR